MLQAPLLAYTHFLEALFVLNGCRAGLGQALRSGTGDEACSLLNSPTMARCCPSGPSQQHRSKRAAIYECVPCISHAWPMMQTISSSPESHVQASTTGNPATVGWANLPQAASATHLIAKL